MLLKFLSLPCCGPRGRIVRLFQLSCAAFAALSGLSVQGQIVISSSYSQDFNSLGTSLPDGWSTWTSSTATANGASVSWDTTEVANNASLLSAGNFRNVPGASQNWSAALSAGTDRALGWRAGNASTRDGSITFSLANTTGYQLTSVSFQLFTPNSSGTAAPVELFYQVGESGTFTSFSPQVTYTTNIAQNPLIVTTLNLSADQLSPLSDQAGQITFSLRNTYGAGASSFQSVAIDNFSYTASAIPEPATAAALVAAAALASTLVIRRRR